MVEPTMPDGRGCVLMTRARGLIGEDFVRDVNAYLADQVRLAGGPPVEVLWCPHRPEDGCRCRKPRPGLLHVAAKRTGLPLDKAAFVGDSRADLAAARAAGVPTFLHACGGSEPCPPPARDGGAVTCLRELAALADALPPVAAQR
ncbi:MAG: HAD hydrolase-like protein [Solirubrobacteraceae bacterium]